MTDVCRTSRLLNEHEEELRENKNNKKSGLPSKRFCGLGRILYERQRRKTKKDKQAQTKNESRSHCFSS